MCDACNNTEVSERDIEIVMPAVELSANWLDSVKPNWRELVNWDILDISSQYHCIAGQVFEEDAEKAGYHSGYGYLGYFYPGIQLSDDYAFSSYGEGDFYLNSKQMTKVWLRWHERDTAATSVA